MTVQLLSIETSSIACSVALLRGDEIFEHFVVAPQQHTLKILPMCEALLAATGCSLSQLDAIAVGHGPGSFTGVRLALSVVQGLAYTSGRPVAPISSLQALAQSAIREIQAPAVLVAVDARMQAVYWGAFQNVQGRAEPLIAEVECAPETVIIPEGIAQWCAIGDGFEAYAALQATRYDHLAKRYPRARDIAWLAKQMVERQQLIAPEDLQARYLRDPDYSK